MGAGQIIVTGTAADKFRLEIAEELGAAATINVEKEDPVDRVHQLTNGRKADIVLDVSMGSTEPLIQGVEMLKKGGTLVVAGVKTHNALNNFYSDKLLFNEISMLGVLSSDWEDTARAIEILTDKWQELGKLCTHNYTLDEAEKAVQLLGREIQDGDEPIHIHLDTTKAP